MADILDTYIFKIIMNYLVRCDECSRHFQSTNIQTVCHFDTIEMGDDPPKLVQADKILCTHCDEMLWEMVW